MGAVLRQLPGDGPVRGRRTTAGDPARPRLPPRRGRARGRRHRPHQADPAEHPAQPDRARVRPRRARGGGRRGPSARSRRGDRRGLRAPDLRRPRARAAGHAAGHVRPHPDHLELGQDVLPHRLEDRLGHRAVRPGRRAGGREELALLLVRGALPAGDRPCPRPRGRLPRAAAQGPPAAARLPVRRARLTGAGRPRPAGHLLHDHRRHPARVTSTARRSAPPWPTGRRSWPSPTRCSTRTTPTRVAT